MADTDQQSRRERVDRPNIDAFPLGLSDVKQLIDRRRGSVATASTEGSAGQIY